jgi:hydrogenase/urease accessory protein HupE
MWAGNHKSGARTQRLANRLVVGALWLICFLSAPPRVLAHEPGLSGLELSLQSNALVARLILSPADAIAFHPMDANQDGRVGPQELESARWVLEELALDALEIRFGHTEETAASSKVGLNDNGDVEFELEFPRPPGDRLQVRSRVFPSLPRGHRQLLVVREGDRGVGLERMLDAHNDRAEVDFAAPKDASWRTAGRFLALGVEHILHGYDHLLFLVGLLLVGGGFRTAVKTITAFTLAHSVTLALATLDWVRVPGAVVEPLIALSIVYVGLENLLRRDLERRWILAFAFGLVHGLGFASVLRDLGIGQDGAGLLAPLIGFNLGVELGQLAVAAVVLPLIWQGMKRPFFNTRLVPACSVLVALAGGWWFVDRVFF